jgi:peptidoglycan/LPS O-acetylase OafA/YrhL
MPTSARSSQPLPRNRTWKQEAAQRAARALAAGGVYFLAIALASWSFDPLREIILQRGASPVWTLFAEVTALLVLLAVLAGAATRLFGVRDRAGDRLLVGGTAVTLLVAAELVGGRLVRGWGPYETLTSFAPEPTSLFLGLLVGAVLVPLVEPSGRPKRRSPEPD